MGLWPTFSSSRGLRLRASTAVPAPTPTPMGGLPSPLLTHASLCSRKDTSVFPHYCQVMEGGPARTDPSPPAPPDLLVKSGHLEGRDSNVSLTARPRQTGLGTSAPYERGREAWEASVVPSLLPSPPLITSVSMVTLWATLLLPPGLLQHRGGHGNCHAPPCGEATPPLHLSTQNPRGLQFQMWS